MKNLKDSLNMLLNDEKSLKTLIKKESWVEPLLIILVMSFIYNLLGGSIIDAIVFLVLTVIVSFLSVGILHLILKLFGSKENVKKTLTVSFNIQVIPSVIFTTLLILSYFSLYLSGNLAKLLTYLVSILMLIYFPWFIMIYTISLSKVHKLSLLKSYISMILSLIIVLSFISIIVYSYAVLFLPELFLYI